MLTDEDIKKLTEVFATRVELDTKFDAMHESFSDLQAAVDAYARPIRKNSFNIPHNATHTN
ncbi:MAG: hypothetical protein A3C85_03375 [Candidatus Doudnabacteria bacterium RIFCSPHIGHO2_02_FULL_48_21]|uniref:Uncharacterized protein n=1 Tax=Candidatus Doudnabacteria bacterium RIFCSPLOWO2_02_FULL_48_13 TaxID=1817845 RepID=A0A1F5QBS6_9BACT|nr:MAG: hypothetical protein A3K05_03745 [Candidatus Doudnabacteria bacterium RIFCSPHIGHO2_01_48_18]OGE78410.1 MAG: hypothetical protein A2668_02135 [Candidatus Doudnabacteria bacterium RIFCSPHIGHO2_01_FULL_48_180]OGE91434.1 MAG: hypothetical protein A3F44_00775 [Candidatus Doudnabacteria bacterium RIFCSPHIGHO2_12_FULL_47_25]OGE93282.1 MAG: hypothetical protein A3C85_03375 [Candidatus Doudnabacteria bacterium RIFCSPHIGHO2_02_FULL_48_21]OGE96826.1 MAG: hypothetical protein A3A83_02175 [Candidatu